MTTAKQLEKKNNGLSVTLTTMDYVAIICDTFKILYSAEGEEIIKRAFEKSGLGQDLEFIKYRNIITY